VENILVVKIDVLFGTARRKKFQRQTLRECLAGNVLPNKFYYRQKPVGTEKTKTET
jgi:hypothetical protein